VLWALGSEPAGARSERDVAVRGVMGCSWRAAIVLDRAGSPVPFLRPPFLHRGISEKSHEPAFWALCGVRVRGWGAECRVQLDLDPLGGSGSLISLLGSRCGIRCCIRGHVRDPAFLHNISIRVLALFFVPDPVVPSTIFSVIGRPWS